MRAPSPPVRSMLTTFFSILTLTLWLYLLRTLGLI